MSSIVSLLKSAIAAASAEQKRLRQRRHDAIGDDLVAVDAERRSNRPGIRHLLLAYALLRGVPYRAVEPTARSKPEPLPIVRAVQDVCSTAQAPVSGVLPSENDVAAWLGSIERFYVIVRADLPPGLVLSQTEHAAVDFALQYPERLRTWRTLSNRVVIVSVPKADDLDDMAARFGGTKVLFVDPDLGPRPTALALEPGEEARRLCQGLPLALRSPRPAAAPRCVSAVPNCQTLTTTMMKATSAAVVSA